MPRMAEKVLTEDQEQTLLVTWMDRKGIKFFAIPNGGKRNLIEAIKLKRTGVRSGVPDLCIPIPRKGYHGLFLELKRVRGGKVSENQLEWLDYLKNVGYAAHIAHGFDEAKGIIENYLTE